MLKNANITSIFKKKYRANVENYRPVSNLPNLSEVYETCMYIQFYDYRNKIIQNGNAIFAKVVIHSTAFSLW